MLVNALLFILICISFYRNEKKFKQIDKFNVEMSEKVKRFQKFFR